MVSRVNCYDCGESMPDPSEDPDYPAEAKVCRLCRLETRVADMERALAKVKP